MGIVLCTTQDLGPFQFIVVPDGFQEDYLLFGYASVL